MIYCDTAPSYPLTDKGVTAWALVRQGLVGDEIEGEACGRGYDLVAVGSHLVEGGMRLLLNKVER